MIDTTSLDILVADEARLQEQIRERHARGISTTDIVESLKDVQFALDRVIPDIAQQLRHGGSTGDEFKDLTISSFGREFLPQQEKLMHLNDVLKAAAGQYVIVVDAESYYYFGGDGWSKEENWRGATYRLMTIGVLAAEPLSVRNFNDWGVHRRFLTINFQDGDYVLVEEPRWFVHLTQKKEVNAELRKGNPDYQEWATGRMPENGRVRPYWRVAPEVISTLGFDSGEAVTGRRAFHGVQEEIPFVLYVGTEQVMRQLVNYFGTHGYSSLPEIYHTIKSADKTQSLQALSGLARRDPARPA